MSVWVGVDVGSKCGGLEGKGGSGGEGRLVVLHTLDDRDDGGLGYQV